MPWTSFIINNMIIIKMNIWRSKMVIPFLAVTDISMEMRASLSSPPAMETGMGWWGCFSIILFPRRCLEWIQHLWSLSFRVPRAYKLMFMHNLWRLSDALVINTKFFSLPVLHPCKEPHVCPCNWDFQISNRHHTMRRWNQKEINIFYLLFWFGKI